MSQTTTQPDLRERFQRLAAEWKQKSRCLSNTAQMSMMSPYQRIIGMGWSAQDTHHWWQPGIYWPLPVSDGDYGIAALEQAFAALGYVACDYGTFRHDPLNQHLGIESLIPPYKLPRGGREVNLGQQSDPTESASRGTLDSLSATRRERG